MLNYFKIFICFLHTVNCFNEPYLVNTEKCKIPNYGPFSPEVVPLYRQQPYKSCSDIPPLTYLRKTKKEATVYIDFDVAPLYGNNVSCCYSNIIRRAQGTKPDDDIVRASCEKFENHTVLTSETVIIYCQDAYENIVFKEVYSPVLKTDRILPKEKPVSVLFVVVDAVSRLNLIRTMPETRNYLLDNDFVEMRGYNKIDDNTFPNFMGFLTGLNLQQLRHKKCMGSKINDLNDCPMLWYKFKDLGYSTAYAEDWAYLGTFNWNMKGFNTTPTTYYYRPYVMAAESLGVLEDHGAPYCAGSLTSGERILNLAKDFSVTLKGDPFFGIFWMNTFSHQRLNTPTRFDKIMRTFFTDLKAEGVLDDSIVIYLSDHGMRTESSIRRTLAGWFEERLPFNLISIPTWFQQKYPNEYNNLKRNSQKLTTPYDLYMTLQHILELSKLNYTSTVSEACPSCQSLFKELPERSCKESGIPVEWCTCNGFLKPLKENETLVFEGVHFILKHMKLKLIKKQVAHLCSNYSLLKVKTAGSSEYQDENGLKYLFISFITSPYADFTVTLRYYESRNKIFFKEVLRIYRFDWEKTECLQEFKINTDFCHCIESDRSFSLEPVSSFNNTKITKENVVS